MSLQSLFEMGGYGGFVWSAYGITALVFFINVLIAQRRLARERQRVR